MGIATPVLWARRFARGPRLLLGVVAALAAIMFAAPVALALQTHLQGVIVDPSPANNGGVPNYSANSGFGSLGGLAVGGSGDLYVVDTSGSASPLIEGTGALHRFNAAGGYQATIDGTATIPASALSLSGDSHVAVDASGNVFVDDTNNGRVLAFDSSGAALKAFGAEGQLTGVETPAGSFSYVCGVAVDPLDGDLLVSDAFNNRIWIFDSSGKYQGRISDSAQLSGPCGLAFDTNGDLYVRNWFSGDVAKFHRSAARTFDFERVAYEPTNGMPAASDVAVDPTTDDLYVDAGSEIVEYEQFGGQISVFAGGAFASGFSDAIAVDGADGKLYADDGQTLRTFSTALTTLPDATTGSTGEVTGTTAVVQGTVDPAGGPEASCVFEYGATTAYGSTAPCQPAGPYSSAQQVTAELTGLSNASTYHYRLHATSSEGAADGADMTLTTLGAPTVEGFSAVGVTTAGVRLEAQVNPGGAATAYRFEYTTAADFDANGFTGAHRVPQPDGALAASSATQSIGETVTGLNPATSYMVRLTVTNSVGAVVTAAKALKTFAVPTVPTAGQFPGQGFLPDHRAWEMVSPPAKNGGGVFLADHDSWAAQSESPGLPAAIVYSSFATFGDVHSTGNFTQYMAVRDAKPGTNGWSTHSVFPTQDSTPSLNANGSYYVGDLSPDLTSGIFDAQSQLNQAKTYGLANLYGRTDLREPGQGSYTLLTGTVNEPSLFEQFYEHPYFVAASADNRHTAFEYQHANLTGDASGHNNKLYLSDDGVTRLVKAFPNCPGAASPDSPCAFAGSQAASFEEYNPHVLSSDGSRLEFTAPVGGSEHKWTPDYLEGQVSRLFQLDDRGTATTADDAIIQLNASEKSAPEVSRPATFQIASADGSRVFFTSAEQLTDTPGSGLYMWQRQASDETQQVTVDATGGSFALAVHNIPTPVGSGDVTEGSNTITAVEAGSFVVGQTVSGQGIPSGAVITEMGSFREPSQEYLVLSKAATATIAADSLSASVQGTTAPLAYNAGASTVQAALEALPQIGAGNVKVTGGPGGAGGSPYSVTFTGALHGVDVAPLTADSSSLAGGAATVRPTAPIRNLTLIANFGEVEFPVVLGASTDGTRLYFVSPKQLVNGADASFEKIRDHGKVAGLFYWQDASGPSGGTLSYIGAFDRSLEINANTRLRWQSDTEKTSRVTPDGRFLLFELSTTEGFSLSEDLGPSCLATDSSPIEGRSRAGAGPSEGCAQAYLYDAEASTPLKPHLVCASCPGDGSTPTASAWLGSLGAARIFVPDNSYLNHALSDDGRYVFFSTAQRLVPEDVNGQSDAYEYDTLTGEQHLLSSGTGNTPSYFVDASGEGHDAYILTSEPLSQWDFDESPDIYDARVDGGLPEPPPVPPSCQGDACQPAPVQFNDPTPASASFQGPGNPSAAGSAVAPKAGRLKHRGKKHVHKSKKSKKRQHKRAAHTNRRAGR